MGAGTGREPLSLETLPAAQTTRWTGPRSLQRPPEGASPESGGSLREREMPGEGPAAPFDIKPRPPPGFFSKGSYRLCRVYEENCTFLWMFFRAWDATPGVRTWRSTSPTICEMSCPKVRTTFSFVLRHWSTNRNTRRYICAWPQCAAQQRGFHVGLRISKSRTRFPRSHPREPAHRLPQRTLRMEGLWWLHEGGWRACAHKRFFAVASVAASTRPLPPSEHA